MRVFLILATFFFGCFSAHADICGAKSNYVLQPWAPGNLTQAEMRIESSGCGSALCEMFETSIANDVQNWQYAGRGVA